MVSTRVKCLAWICALLLALPACGGPRVASKKASSKVTQKKKPSKHKAERRRPPKLAKGEFIWPAAGPLNSPYGWRWGRMHDGIDIGGDQGDPIYASSGGEVVFSDRLGGYGNLVVIKHPNGFFTAYGHNKKNLAKKGAKVKQGQVIARMGKTGNATGEHLHFEIRDKGGTYDPVDILSGNRVADRPEKPVRFDKEDQSTPEPQIQLAEVEGPRLEPLPSTEVPAALEAPIPPTEEETNAARMMELLSDL